MERQQTRLMALHGPGADFEAPRDLQPYGGAQAVAVLARIHLDRRKLTHDQGLVYAIDG